MPKVTQASVEPKIRLFKQQLLVVFYSIPDDRCKDPNKKRSTSAKRAFGLQEGRSFDLCGVCNLTQENRNAN